MFLREATTILSDVQTVVLPLQNEIIGFMNVENIFDGPVGTISAEQTEQNQLLKNPETLAEKFGDIASIGVDGLATARKILLVETSPSEVTQEIIDALTGKGKFTPQTELYRRLAQNADILILRGYPQENAD